MYLAPPNVRYLSRYPPKTRQSQGSNLPCVESAAIRVSQNDAPTLNGFTGHRYIYIYIYMSTDLGLAYVCIAYSMEFKNRTGWPLSSDTRTHANDMQLKHARTHARTHIVLPC